MNVPTGLSVTDSLLGKRKLTMSFNARHFLEHWLNLVHVSKTHLKNSSRKSGEPNRGIFGLRNKNKKSKSAYLKTDSKSLYVLRV